MYITNKGDESKAISLSLHPQKRPPVEATLLLEKTMKTWLYIVASITPLQPRV